MSKQDKINKRRFSLENPLNQKNLLFPTTAQWHPTLPNNKVRGSLIILTTGEWRICFWGGDDYGLERDFPNKEYTVAFNLFESLKSIKDITPKFLKSIGFVCA